MSMFRRTVVIALALGAPVLPAGAANLIVNGGFETPVVAAGSYQLFAPGQSFPGWSVVGAPGNVGVASGGFTQNGFTFPARFGKQWIDLTGTSQTATGIAQKVATAPGAAYVLTFWVGNLVNPGGIFGTTSTVRVAVDGKTVLTAKNSRGAGRTAQSWQRFTTTITAPSATTMIAFFNEDPASDTQNGLDGVTLVPVVTSADAELPAVPAAADGN